MNTLICVATLTTFAYAPTWETSYQSACNTATSQKKPLAIFFSAGDNGWTKNAGNETTIPEINRLLSESYVCVHVDTRSPEGRKLAQAFEITSGHGVVLGDRTASLQAFWHQGDLSSQSLVYYLHKYANPQTVVSGTETVNTGRTSFYPAYPSTAPAMRPANC